MLSGTKMIKEYKLYCNQKEHIYKSDVERAILTHRHTHEVYTILELGSTHQTRYYLHSKALTALSLLKHLHANQDL